MTRLRVVGTSRDIRDSAVGVVLNCPDRLSRPYALGTPTRDLCNDEKPAMSPLSRVVPSAFT